MTARFSWAVRSGLVAANIAVFGGAVVADSLSEIVEASIGYVHIRDNVVFIETQTGGNFCRFDVDDAVFASFVDGTGADGAAFTCIPYDVFNDGFVSSGQREFTQFIDDSEGYTNIRDGVVLVEDGAASSICQITISNADFDRFAAQGTSGVQDARAVCVSIDELES